MDFVGLVAIIMVFGIPLLAIWAAHKQKMRKMELKANDGGNLETRKELANLMYENELLQERIELLESIVSDLPQVTMEDRERLKINIEPKEMTEMKIERQKLIDKK